MSAKTTFLRNELTFDKSPYQHLEMVEFINKNN